VRKLDFASTLTTHLVVEAGSKEILVSLCSMETRGQTRGADMEARLLENAFGCRHLVNVSGFKSAPNIYATVLDQLRPFAYKCWSFI
jgi:hypothetical protein